MVRSMSSFPSRTPILASSEAEAEAAPTRKHRYEWGAMIPWFLTHLAVLGAVWSGVTWQAVAVLFGLFFFRIFSVTAFHHRYFSHRTYSTSRWFQFLMAWSAQTSTQRGVLWWAAHHRAHHLYSDTERDIHSAKQDGFWHSHAGWIFSDNSETDWKRIKDFAKYPELRWLNTWWLVPTVVTGVAVFLLFGWSGLFLGFFGSQILAWHSTYVINSLCHVWGNRRWDTKDTSRNNLWLALLTWGEGWHNNHHHYMNSCRQGFYWWEIDPTYYVIKMLSWVGLVWDIKEPPAKVLEDGRRRDAERRQNRRAASA